MQAQLRNKADAAATSHYLPPELKHVKTLAQLKT
jgi:hypothetical protein